MQLRVPRTAVVGAGLILLGIAAYTGTNHWMNTRIVNPVNQRLSLAAGHIHTGPFRLNLNARYWVTVDSGDTWLPGQRCPDPYPRPQTRWVLFRQGSIIDRNDEPTPINWPTAFDAGPGVYDLDVEVLSDASCLNPSRPRLTIIALTDNYETGAALVRGIAEVALMIGVVLLTFLPVVRAVLSSEPAARITDLTTVGQNFQWAQRMPLQRRFSGLPAFGLGGGMIWAILALLMMSMTAYTAAPASRVLWVHLLRPGHVPQKSDTWTEPLIVSVVYAGLDQQPNLYVNFRFVSRKDLAEELKGELARRKDWVVYVRGDDKVDWQFVAEVIDVARGCHAKVFLSTDKKPSVP